MQHPPSPSSPSPSPYQHHHHRRPRRQHHITIPIIATVTTSLTTGTTITIIVVVVVHITITIAITLLHDRLGNALEPRNDGAHPEQLLNDTTSAFQNAFYKQITSMWPHFTPTAAKLEEFLEDHARTLSVPEEFNITTNSQLHDQKPPQKITSAATHHAFALQ